MDRANRALGTIIAVLLLLIGVAGTLASLGRIPRVARGTALLPVGVRTRWHSWGVWPWVVLAAVGVLLVVLGLLLLRAELRTRMVRPMPDLLWTDPTVGDPAARHRADPVLPGHTRVRSGAMLHGIERDLARHPKVRQVSVGLGGDEARPLLRARIGVAAGADLAKLQVYLAESLTRFTTTTGLRPVDVQVEVTLSDREGARVG